MVVTPLQLRRDTMDDTVKAKSFIRFHLNFMMLMLNCGRTEEAQRSIGMLVAGIDALPDDLFINEPKETKE
jgi:uncharacterized protein YbgA (DUF1722 family)